MNVVVPTVRLENNQFALHRYCYDGQRPPRADLVSRRNGTWISNAFQSYFIRHEPRNYSTERRNVPVGFSAARSWRSISHSTRISPNKHFMSANSIKLNPPPAPAQLLRFRKRARFYCRLLLWGTEQVSLGASPIAAPRIVFVSMKCHGIASKNVMEIRSPTIPETVHWSWKSKCGGGQMRSSGR